MLGARNEYLLAVDAVDVAVAHCRRPDARSVRATGRLRDAERLQAQRTRRDARQVTRASAPRCRASLACPSYTSARGTRRRCSRSCGSARERRPPHECRPEPPNSSGIRTAECPPRAPRRIRADRRARDPCRASKTYREIGAQAGHRIANIDKVVGHHLILARRKDSLPSVRKAAGMDRVRWHSFPPLTPRHVTAFRPTACVAVHRPPLGHRRHVPHSAGDSRPSGRMAEHAAHVDRRQDGAFAARGARGRRIHCPRQRPRAARLRGGASRSARPPVRRAVTYACVHASQYREHAGARAVAHRLRSRARDQQWLFTNTKLPARSKRHVMDGLFEFAELLGVRKPAKPRWDIPVDAADIGVVAALKGNRTLVIARARANGFATTATGAPTGTPRSPITRRSVTGRMCSSRAATQR